jgi:hypothetical protein
MDWQQIIQNFGYVGLIIGGAVLILRKFVDLTFSKGLEQFKGELQKESIRFKATFENLQEKRAKVVEETFQKIVDTSLAFESLINPLQLAGESKPEQKAKEAADQFNGLSKFFHRNEIFFDKKLAGEINSFIDSLKKVWMKFTNRKFQTDGSEVRDVDSWAAAWANLQKDIPVLREKLADNFRALIGVSESSKH